MNHLFQPRSTYFNVPENESKRQAKRRLASPGVALAGFFRRLVGLGADLVLVCAVMVTVLEVVTGGGSYRTTSATSAVIVGTFFGLWFVYGTFATRMFGATLGQRIVGLRSVDARTGRSPHLAQALIRTAIALAPPAGCFVAATLLVEPSSALAVQPPAWHNVVVATLALLTVVSAVWMVRSPKAQTIYDRVARCVVVCSDDPLDASPELD